MLWIYNTAKSTSFLKILAIDNHVTISIKFRHVFILALDFYLEKTKQSRKYSLFSINALSTC